MDVRRRWLSLLVALLIGLIGGTRPVSPRSESAASAIEAKSATFVVRASPEASVVGGKQPAQDDGPAGTTLEPPPELPIDVGVALVLRRSSTTNVGAANRSGRALPRGPPSLVC